MDAKTGPLKKSMMHYGLRARLAVLFSTLMLGGAGPTGYELPAIHEHATFGIVHKTVTSAKMRLVFMLGLEGSGHHYIMSSVKEMLKDNPSLPKVEAELPSFWNYYIPTTMAHDASHFGATSESARQDMRKIAQHAEGVSSPGSIHFISGGISFPCGHGAQKVMQYVDPRRMAEMAEAEGVDFRVLYLRRSAKELLVADTTHRRFQKYTRVVFTDIAVVHSFLGELDPAFVVCHDWNQLGNEEQARQIAAFVAPNDDVADMVHNSLVKSVRYRDAADDILPFDKKDEISNRLQQKLDAFEMHYCSHK